MQVDLPSGLLPSGSASFFDLSNFNKHSLRRVDEERRFDAFWALEPTPALQHGRQAVRRKHCLDPQKKSERVQPRMRFHSVAIAPSHTPAVACNNQTYECVRYLSKTHFVRSFLKNCTLQAGNPKPWWFVVKDGDLCWFCGEVTCEIGVCGYCECLMSVINTEVYLKNALSSFRTLEVCTLPMSAE